jgi:hypothetical protein
MNFKRHMQIAVGVGFGELPTVQETLFCKRWLSAVNSNAGQA